MTKRKNNKPRTLDDFRKLWKQGGKARQAQLTPAQRKELASMGGKARWIKARAALISI
ncbi:MAG: hypothetical protein KGL39_10085 [Patescibacteria group bacterium]|nr:hypothetical protein [Patescibacteria group bacterium]